MRLLPVTAEAASRCFPNDVRLGGYLVPANTWIWSYVFTVQRSPAVWEDPDAYLPVRRLALTRSYPYLSGWVLGLLLAMGLDGTGGSHCMSSTCKGRWKAERSAAAPTTDPECVVLD